MYLYFGNNEVDDDTNNWEVERLVQIMMTMNEMKISFLKTPCFPLFGSMGKQRREMKPCYCNLDVFLNIQ